MNRRDQYSLLRASLEAFRGTEVENECRNIDSSTARSPQAEIMKLCVSNIANSLGCDEQLACQFAAESEGVKEMFVWDESPEGFYFWREIHAGRNPFNMSIPEQYK